MSRSSALCSLVLVFLPAISVAQNGLQSAKGTTSIFQGERGGFALSLDANDSKVAFTWNSSRLGTLGQMGAGPSCSETNPQMESVVEASGLLKRCGKDGSDRRAAETQDQCFARLSAEIPEVREKVRAHEACLDKEAPPLYRFSNNFTLALAAQEGKRTLFSDNNLTPGVEVNEKLGFTRSVGEDGLAAAFVSGDLSVVGRDTARVTESTVPGTPPLVSVGTHTGTSLKLGLGGNWMPFPRIGVFGVSGRWERNWNTPLATDPSEVCEVKTTGASSSGSVFTVSDCKDRFVGRRAGANAGVFRFDWVSPRLDLKRWKPYSVHDEVKRVSPGDYELLQTGVAAGLIFGSQIKVREDVKPNYNVAIGPALYKAYQPLGVVTAILFEFNDLSNSTGKNPHFSDQFGVRLYVGAPF